MSVRAKFWLTFGERTLFGDGKAELLERLDARGSLHAAAAEMGMSYRHAWGLLRELEREAGFALLEHRGAGPRAPLQLSAEARQLLAAWHRFRDPLDALLARRFRQAFGG